MRRFLALTFLSICFSVYTTAQETSSPVQFSFSGKRINDSVAQITITGKLTSGFQLFSAVKKNPDDAFISSVELDSSAAVRTVQNVIQSNTVLSKKDSAIGGEYDYAVDSIRWMVNVIVSSNDSIQLKGNVNWLGKIKDEFPSGTAPFRILIEPFQGSNDVAVNEPEEEKKGMGSIFLFCFIAGLLAVITPCVFPLVPVTVSFFLKKSSTKAKGLRNALWYSASIILIYTIPTVLLTFIFGDAFLYQVSTHPVSNLLFFAIFLIFAISFFGAFELTLPSSWANKADQQAGKGGLLGIFFMALTLVIVSFSCTGPIVGTLLGQTSNQGISIAPIIGMFAFSLGLALPFAVFAMFPSMLQSLPKSGGWLNSVKVVFGFIELALALKFLSNVDLIYHWHILDREIFLVFWIVIAILLGMYLLGKLKFSHDSDLPFITIPRLFFAIISFSFALYLIPGLWGAPLKRMSGFLPPITTQDFNLMEARAGNNSSVVSNIPDVNAPKKYTDILKAPLGLRTYFDLDEGMAAARAAKKPVMLDFTGHSCANCRKMEEYVWSDPQVLNRISNDFILISLYVDESTELPISEQYKNAKGESIITVGDKNLDYERTKFGFGAQPLYMFLDLDGKPLSNVKYGYDADIQKFVAHLEKVKAEFQKRNK